MNARRLAARRARLVARSSRLRAQLRRDTVAFAGRLATVDRLAALAASPWTRMLASAGAAVLLFRRPRRLLRLALRLAPLYPSVRPLIERWLGRWRGRRRARAAAPGGDGAGVSPPP